MSLPHIEFSSFHRNASQISLGHTLMTSLNLTASAKTVFPSRILSQELGFQHTTVCVWRGAVLNLTYNKGSDSSPFLPAPIGQHEEDKEGRLSSRNFKQKTLVFTTPSSLTLSLSEPILLSISLSAFAYCPETTLSCKNSYRKYSCYPYSF